MRLHIHVLVLFVSLLILPGLSHGWGDRKQVRRDRAKVMSLKLKGTKHLTALARMHDSKARQLTRQGKPGEAARHREAGANLRLFRNQFNAIASVGRKLGHPLKDDAGYGEDGQTWQFPQQRGGYVSFGSVVPENNHRGTRSSIDVRQIGSSKSKNMTMEVSVDEGVIRSIARGPARGLQLPTEMKLTLSNRGGKSFITATWQGRRRANDPKSVDTITAVVDSGSLLR